jgi:hypothetical protein
MIFEIGINLLCLFFGPYTIIRLWRRRAELEGFGSLASPPSCAESLPQEDEDAPSPSPARLFRLCTRLNMGLTSIFGILFLAFPLSSLLLLGLSTDPGAITMLQAYGCSLVFLAVLCYWFRDAANRRIVSALSVANCIEDTLLAVLLGVRTFQGHLNALGWIFTALFALEVIAHAVVLAGLRRNGLVGREGDLFHPVLPRREGSTS